MRVEELLEVGLERRPPLLHELGLGVAVAQLPPVLGSKEEEIKRSNSKGARLGWITVARALSSLGMDDGTAHLVEIVFVGEGWRLEWVHLRHERGKRGMVGT